ncbi:hypothetical protein NUW54_g5582 [Trametes sanguinea]|uniref:Uncharacterized protein n=1 Tax=Trametes sanguinea TaxID=158606 RepID=A0ACC1PWC4_9APHY|nr:hypothetical protein NUW54_g5582 [Trametes sanguinea]
MAAPPHPIHLLETPTVSQVRPVPPLNHPQSTINAYVLHYYAPHFNPPHRPPTDLRALWTTFGNTTPRNDPRVQVDMVLRWALDLNTMRQQLWTVWNTLYQPHGLDQHIIQLSQNVLSAGRTNSLVRPLADYWPAYFAGMFSDKASLTSRIDSSLWINFTRTMHYIGALHVAHVCYNAPRIYPVQCEPVYPDHGSNTNKNCTRYCPDSCAKANPAATPPRSERACLFGDINLSYKFHSLWMDQVVNPAFTTTHAVIKFKKVLTQLMHYMCHCGSFSVPGQGGQAVRMALRYAYILTDEEVFLVSRGASTHQVYISDGFPLRPVTPPGPNSGATGMHALIYIYLLASGAGYASLSPV